MTKEEIKSVIESAKSEGDLVEIRTKWSIYDDASIEFIEGEEIQFTATHPLKGSEYVFSVKLSEIETAELV
jgi:hypothetical protein